MNIMNCEQARHYLDPLVDNALSIDLTAEVMRHLDACLECQDQWTKFVRLQDTVSGVIERIDVPAGLTDRIKAHVDKNMRIGNSFSLAGFSPRLLSAAAAIILIAIVAVILVTNMSSKSGLLATKLGSKDALVATGVGSKNTVVAHDLVADHKVTAAAVMTMKSSSPQHELLRLQKQLALGPVNLPEWKLIKVEACQIDTLPAIHLCYVNDRKQMLSCYQLKHGLFDTGALKRHSINGRIFCCGQLKDVSIVYCPSDTHDKVLVSAMPERELMSIAKKS